MRRIQLIKKFIQSGYINNTSILPQCEYEQIGVNYIITIEQNKHQKK